MATARALLDLSVDVPEDPAAECNLTALPTGRGVVVVEDEAGRAASITATANVRRLMRSRLAPDAPRPIDRSIARRIRVARVASSFESDWAFLAITRTASPSVHREMLDRWGGWFVHCDLDAAFPQFAKTETPSDGGSCLGPFADKQAAQRYVELLESAFDLCRYHHLLTQAPHAQPCAYKEMGRCAAPCDGSVPMEAYRAQVRAALAFARTNAAQARRDLQAAMLEAGQRRDYERAAALRRQWEETAAAEGPSLRWAQPTESLAYLVVQPSEQSEHARVFLITAAMACPLADIPRECVAGGLEEVAQAALHAVRQPCRVVTREPTALLARHLFAPRASETLERFVPVRTVEATVLDLTRALRRLGTDEVTDPGLEALDASEPDRPASA